MKDALQYLLGAGILGVLVSQIVTMVREGLARTRERDGLLRILSTELIANHRSVGFLLVLFRLKKGDVAAALPNIHVRTDAWEATRVMLAPHLSGREFGPLSHYYKNLVVLEEETHREAVRDDTLDALHLLLNRLDEQGEEVQGIVRINVSDISADKLSEEDVERLRAGRSLGELLEDDH